MINDTYTIRIPNGELKQVNIFDYNLKYACNSWVQCEDDSWIKARDCHIVQSDRVKA